MADSNLNICDLEEEFVDEFYSYLRKISDVRQDFTAGGTTTAPSSSTKTIFKEGALALIGMIPGLGDALKPAASEGIQKVDDSYTRQERYKINQVIPQGKEEAQKMFVDAGVKIFRMFEYQFSLVQDNMGKTAMAILAEDAVERVINYVTSDRCKEKVNRPNFKVTSNFIFNAVLLGKSSNAKSMKFEDGSTWKTNELFENSGYFEDDEDNVTFYELKKDSKAATYKYKKLWRFDEFYKGKAWKDVNKWSQYKEYKLAFDEKDVKERVNALLNKWGMKEFSTRGDLKRGFDDISQKITEVKKAKVQSQPNNRNGQDSTDAANSHGSKPSNLENPDDEIRLNLIYLTQNISSVKDVAHALIAKGIISKSEKDEIDHEHISTEKNYKLLNIIQKKNWRKVRTDFLQILKQTENEECAAVIEGTLQPRNESNN